MTNNNDTIDKYALNFIKYFPETFDNANVDVLAGFMTAFLLCEMKIDDVKTRINTLRENRVKLANILSTPQVPQRSPEWYEMRRGRLTASAIAQATGTGKYGTRNTLVRTKAFPELETPFNSLGCAPLRHGIILEDMSARCYSQRMNGIKIHNFGLIPHPTLECFGASPDGINELGIMIEIKTPYKREVDGNIPDEYLLQMQGQMAVCELDECDFIDASIVMSDKIDEYLQSVDGDKTVDHGIIVEYKDTEGQTMFDYSPENLTPSECLKWANISKKEHNSGSLLLGWRLMKICIKRVHFDKDLWTDLVPKIELFWNDVCCMRKQGLQQAILDTPIKRPRAKKERESSQSPPKNYSFIESDDESDDDSDDKSNTKH